MAGTFDLIPLRLHFTATGPIHFPPASAANLLRGTLGKSLMTAAPDAYARMFAPEFAGGPSGLRDAPRPFVCRAAPLDGQSIAAGASFQFGVNLFETRDEVADLFAKAFEDRFGPARIEGRELLRLPIEMTATSVHFGIKRVRVRFLTPTELKGCGKMGARPEFGPLFARIRDRVSTLRALYGAGPLEIDFKAMGERSNRVRLTRCDLQHIEAERTSRATGDTHSLGGFTGVAEYEGDVSEFLPYLAIAKWTGVGRQTVWGKGEIAWETF